ncbi:MAG: TIGR04255 family protein [Actinomycetota bacterium]|nr:TIGR04255 family protein [Actinomycetota bacterium]
MVDEGRDHPRFARPPVEEVSLAAHVKPVPLGLLSLGSLAKAWEAEYPTIQEMAPLAPLQEDLGQAGIRVEMLEQPPMPRIWYMSTQGDLMRQVQMDRFVQNWRRVAADDDYPHYEGLLPQFVTGFSDYEATADSSGQAVLVTACEVTYTNPIRLVGAFQSLGSVQQVLAPWSGQFSNQYLPEPSSVSTALRFAMGPTGPAGISGTLDVTASPAVQATTAQQVLLLQLTGRARPTPGGPEGIRHVLEAAHEWVVCGFKSMTTPEMHQEWEEK